MGDSNEPGLTPQGAEVVCDLSGVELTPVIEDPSMRDAEAGDDVLPDEFSYFNSGNRSHCFDLYPLCEIIHGDKEVLALPSSLGKRP